MTHKIAKLMLENAGTFLERTEAVETAISLGMPMYEIEEYLDWLELTRPGRDAASAGEKATSRPVHRPKAS